MNLGDLSPSDAWFLVGLLLAVPAVGLALLGAPWRRLIARPERQHAFFASLLLLPLLWSMAIALPDGMRVHLLGMTTVTLLFGWRLAVLLGAAASLVLVLIGTGDFYAWPVDLLLSTLLPVVVTVVLLAAADRLRRTNIFVYMLGVGFGGGMLSLLASLLAGAAVSGAGLDHAAALLLVFPEGFLNGTLVTGLAVFRPTLLRTYDDQRYLDGR
jgi:uncharacterized membrane protein